MARLRPFAWTSAATALPAGQECVEFSTPSGWDDPLLLRSVSARGDVPIGQNLRLEVECQYHAERVLAYVPLLRAGLFGGRGSQARDVLVGTCDLFLPHTRGLPIVFRVIRSQHEGVGELRVTLMGEWLKADKS